MKTLLGSTAAKAMVAFMALGLLTGCGSKTNRTSSTGSGQSGIINPVPILPSQPGYPNYPGQNPSIPLPGTNIPGYPTPLGTEQAVAQVLMSTGCQAYLQPTTFYKQAYYSGNTQDFRGQYQMTYTADAITGTAYMGRSSFKDVIVFRKHGSPVAITAYSITVYMCAYGNVITTDRVVDGVYVNNLVINNSQQLAVNEVTSASIYMGLSASQYYPQSAWFLNTFFPIY